MTGPGIRTKSGVYLSEETIEEIAAAFERGEWPGTTTRLLRGRPPMYGERLKSVTYKDTAREIAAMDIRAANLDMSRSDYLRFLVRQDLADASVKMGGTVANVAEVECVP